MKKSLLLGIGGVLLFTGCCKKLSLVDCNNGACNSKSMIKKADTKDPIIKTVKNGDKMCIIDNKTHKTCILMVEAKGIGIVPCSGACSTAQAKVMARRAAILDGYRALIEKIYGIQINGRDTVRDMALQSSVLRSHIEGLVRGATIEEEDFKNGIYTVVMSVKLNINKWNEYLASSNNPYNPPYTY